jgi:predicted transcriptional regulator
MSSKRTSIYGLNNARIHVNERKGQRWHDDEVLKLLTLVRSKTSIREIAQEHQRSITAINLKLRSLAADYYYYENRSIQEIQRFTGLKPDEIKNAIEVRRSKELPQEEQQEQTQSQTQEPTMKQMMVLLTNIQNRLMELEGPEPTMRDLMRVASDIQNRLNSLQ